MKCRGLFLEPAFTTLGDGKAIQMRAKAIRVRLYHGIG